jgi:hypothetical protein
MTEAEWQACQEPQRMLNALRGRVSERKLRLFAVACCRRLWHLFDDPRSRIAVEVAESLADGLARDEDREAARAAAQHARRDALAARRASEYRVPEYPSHAATAAYFAVSEMRAEDGHGDIETGEAMVAVCSLIAGHRASRLGGRDALGAVCCHLLREIVGNPFCPAPVDPSWLYWNDGAVRKLAEVIYGENRWDEAAILADALEDAGCADEGILGHLRGPGPHCKGCHVVDALLGKS